MSDTDNQQDAVPLDAAQAGRTRDRLLTAILAMLVLYAMALAQALIVPMVIALLASLMLAPAVRMLCQFHLPRMLATLLVVGSVLMLLLVLIGSLASPARAWLDDAPRALARIERVVVSLQQPFRAASEAGERLAEMAESGDVRSGPAPKEAKPNQMLQVLRAAPAAMTSVLVTVILSFVFLLHGENLLRKLVELAPVLRLKKEVVMATRNAQRDLSMYMRTITVINIGLGALTALGLWLLGVPNPLLWGGVAALLNYAPYVGPLVMLMVLTVVGFGSFDSVSQALMLPGFFLLLNILEGQLFTPLTLGRRLALDPIMVFLGLVTLGWLWGIAGVLLALPMLTCIRILAERVSGWEVLAKLLRRADLPTPALAVREASL